MCVFVSAYVVGRGEGSDPSADVPVVRPLICGVNDVSGLMWPLLLSVSQRLIIAMTLLKAPFMSLLQVKVRKTDWFECSF